MDDPLFYIIAYYSAIIDPTIKCLTNLESPWIGLQGFGVIWARLFGALGLRSASKVLYSELLLNLRLWLITQPLLRLQESVLPFWKPHGKGFKGLRSDEL